MLQTFIDVLFEPERQRRIENGTMEEKSAIALAQAVIHPKRGTKIRFNNECRFEIDVKPGSEGIDPFDLPPEEIISLKSSEAEDVDAGHVGMFLHRNGKWCGTFDLRHFIGKSKELIEASKEYVEGVEFACSKEYWRLYSECMFAAVELLSKSLVLNSIDEKHVDRSSHNIISSAVNFQRKLGNIPSDYVDLNNYYGNLRNDARYVGGSVNYISNRGESDIKTLKQFLEYANSKYS